LENDVSIVVNRTDLIENLLDQVVESYCAPRKEVTYFFRHVVLNSSIMPLGSKIKVAMAISQELGVKLKQDSLHKVVSYRNSFAHHGLGSHSIMYCHKDPSQDEVHNHLFIIKNSGKTEMVRRQDALDEFNKNYEIAKQSLVELRDAIKTSNP